MVICCWNHSAGLAKTRAVKSLAQSLDAQMRRIQFTPDLLPADITGTEVLHQQDGENIARSHGRTADHRGQQNSCDA